MSESRLKWRYKPNLTSADLPEAPPPIPDNTQLFGGMYGNGAGSFMGKILLRLPSGNEVVLASDPSEDQNLVREALDAECQRLGKMIELAGEVCGVEVHRVHEERGGVFKHSRPTSATLH